MMEARFRHFLFPRTLTKAEQKDWPPCAACCARWLGEYGHVVAASHPDLAPPHMSPSIGAAIPAPAGTATGTSTAVEAIRDWLETHSGEVRVKGPDANVSALADSLAWSQNYLPSVGRLVPFLRAHGTYEDPDLIEGIN